MAPHPVVPRSLISRKVEARGFMFRQHGQGRLVSTCSPFPHYIGKKGVRVLIEAALLGGSVIARFTFERNCYVLELSCVPVPLPKMSKGLFMLCHECPKDYHVTCSFR